MSRKLDYLDTLREMTNWNWFSVVLYGWLTFMVAKVALAYLLAFHTPDELFDRFPQLIYMTQKEVFRHLLHEDKSSDWMFYGAGILVSYLWFQHYRKKYARYNDDVGLLEQLDEPENETTE
ncbi:MAG: hypothetical protein OXG08_04600 [Gammaproteobacteria bacterium]|nr:hypothetical protein [Gammaproteobacteria bacterium]